MKVPLSSFSFFKRKIPNRKLGLNIKSPEKRFLKDVDYQNDRRAFDRFPIEFEIEVRSEDAGTEIYKEKALLKNISGEGIKFVTRKSNRYSLDQKLEIFIYLPANNEVKARMKGDATVVRIDPTSNSRLREKNEEMDVAVKFNDPLHFERLFVRIPVVPIESIS